MKTCIYLTPMIGSGTRQDPFRCKLNNYIDPAQGDIYSSYDSPGRRIAIAVTTASDAAHAAIAADSGIIAITPLADDIDMDALAGSLPNAAAVKTALESMGINTGWMNGTVSLRDCVRYILRVFYLAQRAEGEMNTAVQFALKQGLDNAWSGLTATQKNNVKSWMADKGLATGWINASTTIRQLVHFCVQNLGIGTIRLHGLDF